MDERAITCCFTGHRPNRVPWIQDPKDLRTRALAQALWERIHCTYRQGYTRFLTGMAQGVDLMCALLVLQLALEDPAVVLIPVLPYPTQTGHWPARDRMLHERILQACGCDPVIVSPRYHRGCFQKRNRYLVDHASKIIGVYDGTPQGGTHQTLEYAKGKGLAMELLLPG